MSSPPPQEQQQREQHEQLYKTLHHALTNIGKSLTCPLCLSTYQDPVLLPCVHTYCRGCISQSLSIKPQCPTCLFKCTKRSIVDSPVFIDMVRAYKMVLQSMGWTPIVYDENVFAMTQIESPSQTPGKEECQLHYQVSKTWQRVLESSFANDALRRQQAAVVAVDQRALAAAKMGEEEASAEDHGSQDLMLEMKSRNVVQDDTVAGLGDFIRGIGVTRLQSDPFLDAKAQDDDDETTLDEEESYQDMTTISHNLATPANAKPQDDETTLDETIQDITTVIANQNLVLGTPANVKLNEASTCPRDNKTRSDSNTLLDDRTLARQDSSYPLKDEPETIVEYSESMAFFTAESQTNTESQTNGVSQEAGYEVARMDSETVARIDNEPATRSANSNQVASEASRNVRMDGEAVARIKHVARSDSDAGYQSDSELVSHMDSDAMVDSVSATSESATFSKGAIVQVQDRTWPGVNKPGGVARVTKIHLEGTVISYDVAYVLGGREKQVEAVFVSEQEPDKKRRAVQDENEFSSELIASLAAEGFDTEGKVKLDEVKRVEVKTGVKRKVLDVKKTNENAEPEARPTKKRRKEEMAKKATAKKGDKQGPPPLPALSDEQKCALADAHYEERYKLAESECVISVVASSLAEGDMEMLRLLCKETKRLGVKVKSTETFHANQTTLIIMPIDSQSNKHNPTSRTRTLKAMRGMLAGVPIVDTAWISACLDKGKAVVPSSEMYIRTVPAKKTDPRINDSLGAALCAARIQQARKLPQHNIELPLSNALVLLCGQYNSAEGSPRKADVLVLLRESGATLLPSAGAAMKKLKSIGDNDSSKIVLLCDECQTNEHCGISDGFAKEIMATLVRDHQRLLVVSSGWLFDSISCGGMIPSQLFEPRSPRAKGLWEAGNRPSAD